jgi:microtubule-associated protein, RP/EB family
MASFGMMDGAYFVGRLELLKWINSFLGFNYSKIEEVCSGVAFCLIMDALHPGMVALPRVKFDAKHEFEFINNLKVLQTTFDRLHMNKV